MTASCKVLCTNNKDFEGHLTNGRVYEAVDDREYWRVDPNDKGNYGSYRKDRFEVVATVDEANPKDRLGMKKVNEFLVPPALTFHTARAFEDGAAKYGPYNWREKKVKASVYIAAAKRHLNAWQDGEATSADAGVHHLGHVAACLAILLDAEATGNLIDDRPTPGSYGKLVEEFKRKT